MLNTQRLLLLAWDNLGVGIIVVITTRDKHYYDEDNVKIGGSGKCDVSVGGQTTLTKPINQQPSFKRGKAKKEENKLQLSLFD